MTVLSINNFHLFARHTAAFIILHSPRIVLRRLVTAAKTLSIARDPLWVETLLLLLSPAFLTSHRLREQVFSLRGELFLELFRYIFTCDRDDIRRYVCFVSSIMPTSGRVARRSVHVASQHTQPFDGVLFCQPSLMRRARSITCLQGAQGLSSTTVLLYIHGGGWCTGTPTMAAGMFERMVTGFSARNVGQGDRRLVVFSLEYGLAPEHPFPYALQQAVHAYLWLLQQGYHSIMLGGDSAGGNLALATMLLLRDAYAGTVPMPAGALLLSPWVNLTDIHPAEALGETFFGHDIVSPCKAQDFKQAYLGDSGHVQEACKNPLVSPALANLHGLPPMWINAGGDELLLESITAFADKASDSGIAPLILDVDQHMVHVYPTLVEGLDHPAAEHAIQRAVDFMLCVTTNASCSTTRTLHTADECCAGAHHHHSACSSGTPRSPAPRRQLALADEVSSLHARGDWSGPERGALRVVRSPSSPEGARPGLAGVLDAVSPRGAVHDQPPGSPSPSETSSVAPPWRGEILTVTGTPGGLGTPGAPAPGLPVGALPMAVPLWEGAELVLPTVAGCDGKSDLALCFEGCSVSTSTGMVGVDWSEDHTVLQLML